MEMEMEMEMEGDNMSDEVNEVALRLKELRESCGMEAGELAVQIGIPPDVYKSYEESGQDIPISVLYKVVNIFNVDLTELLTGSAPKLDAYCVVRDGEGLSIDRYPGYSFKSVAFNFLHRKMEPLIVDVEYEGDNAHTSLVTHTGQEFNYIIAGSIKLTLGKKEITLSTGDSCYFNPMIPHGQKAVSERARFLTVILE
ncbi:MAG: XRE family transcriptional regulator [Oscillospiraceae bacterium]|nr:XRE family transcriptional regulator [Oscillospiraceae bacterium]